MTPDPKPLKRIKDPAALKRFHLEHANEPCELCELRPGTDAHHVTFRSQGGDDGDWNLLLVCRPCHHDLHRDSKLRRAAEELVRERRPGSEPAWHRPPPAS